MQLCSCPGTCSRLKHAVVQSVAATQQYSSGITKAQAPKGLPLCLNTTWAEFHLDGMSGGLPPDGLPAALHNRNLLPSFDQTTTLQLINAPAASGNGVSNNQSRPGQHQPLQALALRLATAFDVL